MTGGGSGDTAAAKAGADTVAGAGAGAGAEAQAEIIAWLARPEAYGLAADAPVALVCTHISVVFLAGARAYKLKRAVRLPYLDFSTAGLRRRYAERELAINRRTAPRLYEAVVPVVRTAAGGLAIGGDGEAVDWLVVMRRFAEEAVFSRLAAAGRLDRHTIWLLADVVAGFHAAARRCPDGGGAAAMAAVIAGNRASFAAAGLPLADDRLAALDAGSARVLAQVAPLLDRRRDAGFVRHGHGDLHLGNIVVLDGRPVLFDAIEFSDALATIDVLYDLAFLVMDLDEQGHRGLAQLLLNRYLDAGGDGEGLALLPLFLSLRAAIRSHVRAAAGDAAACGRYLDFALAYLQPVPPRLIAIGGLSGTGKSRLAQALATDVGRAPGARVVRSDATRKRLAAVALDTRLAADHYTAAGNRRTYAAMLAEAATALAAGQAVIVDAVFARPDERQAVAAVAAAAGVPFRGLWLEAPPALLTARVAARRNDVSDATPAVVRRQLDYDLGPIDWPRLSTAGDWAAVDAAARAALAG